VRLVRLLAYVAAALGLVVFVACISFGWLVDREAIRDPGLHSPSVGQPAFIVRVNAVIDMPVYSVGNIEIGCAVFFPGQHGLSGQFESHVAPLLASRGVAVFTATYASTPNGQRLTLEQAEAYALEVVDQVERRCGHRYVVVGRSLGSMVAAYAVRNHHPAALLLEDASPSLASAVRSVLRPRLGSRLVDLMPIEWLLTTNYSLWDALGTERRFPVTVIQGTRDLQTPISALTAPRAVQSWIEIVPVKDADHEGTWQAVMPPYTDRIVGVLLNSAPSALRPEQHPNGGPD
jgi:pimeloyl-ACP methyl ester carboxylesterase